MIPVISRFKVLVLNAENLFLLSDEKLTTEHLKLDSRQWGLLSTSVFENKPLPKLNALAKIILNESPDLVMLCEVGGLESLQNFNQLFLNSQYSCALIEGNSNRSIDVGFLIKKTQDFYFDIVSNKNRAINYLYPHERLSQETDYSSKLGKLGSSHRFSRDVAELHLFKSDRNKPFAIFMLTHLKSRRDPDHIDPAGFERRQAELKSLIEIYLELENKYQNQVPIAIGGDFNGNASPIETDIEFSDLYKLTKLKDVCALAGLSKADSATYYQINRNSQTEGKQLDYCFLSPQMAPYLLPESVKVFRYVDHLGLPMDPPTTIDTKLNLPSDHYPLLFTLQNLPLV